jgi:hypothetical protein
MAFIIVLAINIWSSIIFFKMGVDEGKKHMEIIKVVKQTQESINNQCADWFFTANFKQVKKDICKGSKK